MDTGAHKKQNIKKNTTYSSSSESKSPESSRSQTELKRCDLHPQCAVELLNPVQTSCANVQLSSYSEDVGLNKGFKENLFKSVWDLWTNIDFDCYERAVQSHFMFMYVFFVVFFALSNKSPSTRMTTLFCCEAPVGYQTFNH